MYAAAAWLAWVFAGQGGVAALPFLFAAAVALAFAAWCFGVGQRAASVSRAKSIFPHAVALIALAVTVAASLEGARLSAPAAGAAQTASAGAIPIEPWSESRVAELQAAGKPVFVDFTAAWCVTCQVNERTALATKAVADAFAHTGAVYLKADWTRRDAKIANALTALGRSGVPLYLVYGKAATPKILPQLLTPGLVVQALNGAKS
jgi:thiol:disulfide interchange protein DsbD